jgi:cytoskeletal protein CcmA (bactofilin family)
MFELGRKRTAGRGDGSAPDQDFEREPAAIARGGMTGSRDSAVIGRLIHIEGNVRGEQDLRVEGHVQGSIQLRNNALTIGTDGKVTADVYAKVIMVDGLIEGDLFASELVSIRKSGRVLGNITASRVTVEDGARFRGFIEMDPEAVEAAFSSGTSQSSQGAQTAPKLAPAPSAVPVAKPAVVSNVKT